MTVLACSDTTTPPSDAGTPGPAKTLDARLEDELSGLYIDIGASRRIVDRAALDPKRIAFRETAAENWFNIVAEARAKDGGLLALVEAARSDFPDSAELREIEDWIIKHPPPVRPAARRKRALLVGVADYREGLPALSAANHNVDDLRKLLEQPSFGFQVATLANPSKQQLLDALEALFLDADRNDLLVFYYAGHVLLTDKRAVHFTARDTIAQPQNLTARALAFSALEQDFLGISKAQILLLIDGCWSQVGTDRYGDISQDVLTSALDPYLGRGCDKVLIASGAGAGPAAWQDRHSPLTAGILDALRREGADSSGDGALTAEELIHALDEGDGRGGAGSARPIHRALHIAPAWIELRGSSRGTVELKPDEQRFVASLKPALQQGLVMPFFGDGVYGNGPLSFSGLATELALQAGLGIENRGELGLATAAESLEMHRGNRRTFLRSLRSIIDDQTARCDPPVAYDLLLDLEPPWVAVTVNYDSLLERRLADRPYVLVSHVLRVLPDPDDAEGERQPRMLDEPAAGYPAAMMLVVRSKNHPLVKENPAREVELRPPADLGTDDEKDRVIYHLLGAPFLNDLPFARDRGLDTVAISETDYIVLLTKLRNKATGVPSALISRWFRTKSLLFLEYHLDVWHYRLLSHVFRNKAGVADGSVAINPPYVVRVEPSPMEQHFWKRFTPDRVSLDLKTLVRALRAGRP